MILSDILPLIMFGTLVVLMFSGFPVGFVMGGVAVIFGLLGIAVGTFSSLEFFNIVARIYGAVVQNYILVAIPMFIFMGTVLEKSGIGEELLQTLQRLLWRVPGGLAVSVTLLGTIMAATTGIVGASVVMLTMLALPVLVSKGYNKALACGTVASAGTLGILIPPSIMLVLMADLLVTSVGKLFLAALIPGLLLAVVYIVFIVAYSKYRPSVAPNVEREPPLPDGRSLGMELARTFFPPVLLIFLVLGSIGAGWATTTEAAGVGAFGAFLIAAMKRRVSVGMMSEVVESAGRINAMLFLIFVGATAFSYVFRALGGDYLVEDLVRSSGADSWTILIGMMALVFVMGFFFEWIEITMIVLPIFLPIFPLFDFGSHVQSADVVIWIAVMMAINLQTSFLTPPFGITLFYMRGCAPEGIRMPDIYRGVIPFVIFQLLAVLAVAFFPSLVLWLPHSILD